MSHAHGVLSLSLSLTLSARLPRAKAFGLELLPVPLNFYQNSDPFFSPIDLEFPGCSALDDSECDVFLSALLTRKNFLLMQASSFEWVHVSGCAFVTVSHHALAWYYNTHLLERDKAERGLATALLAELQSTMGKYQRAFEGEPDVLDDAAELQALLDLIPLSAMRPKVEALLSKALVEPSADLASSPVAASEAPPVDIQEESPALSSSPSLSSAAADLPI